MSQKVWRGQDKNQWKWVTIAANDLYLPYPKTDPPVFVKGKGKAVPLQASSGPEGSGKLRFPDFTTTAQNGGKVVSLTHRPPLPPGKYTWYSSLLEAESTPGP